MKTHTVDVEIRGRNYQLRSDDDPAYVRALAEMVDKRMAIVEANTKTVDSIRLAVLAALNLADEYCRLRDEYEGRIEDLERERERLGSMIDEALEEEHKISLPDA